MPIQIQFGVNTIQFNLSYGERLTLKTGTAIKHFYTFGALVEALEDPISLLKEMYKDLYN